MRRLREPQTALQHLTTSCGACCVGQAHLHHYTKYMEEADVDASMQTVQELMADYAAMQRVEPVEVKRPSLLV